MEFFRDLFWYVEVVKDKARVCGKFFVELEMVWGYMSEWVWGWGVESEARALEYDHRGLVVG